MTGKIFGHRGTAATIKGPSSLQLLPFSLPLLSYYADMSIDSRSLRSFFPRELERSIFAAPERKTGSMKTRPSTSAVLPPGMKGYIYEPIQSWINLLTKNSFYDSGQFTDLTITCGSEEFQCHKIVLCSQSKFFKAACTSGFNVSLLSMPNVETRTERS